VLKLSSVTKSYNHNSRRVLALNDVSLEIAKGEFVSVVGPSGSGKSTLLLLLGGMLAPASGQVSVDGQSLYELGSDARAALRKKKIGFVFQTFNLVPYLSAIENVQIPLFLAGRNKHDQQERAAALLGRLGLADRLDHKPSELSVGQQQRVALARMMANDPAVILADEPTGNLDPETGVQVVGFLDELHREGRTVVMVTHDPRAAQRSKRRLRLVDGRIHSDDTGTVSPEPVWDLTAERRGVIRDLAQKSPEGSREGPDLQSV
jgi:putative ABC transport system ATP-binding protein